MKAHYKTASGRLTFELEGADAKELFRGIAQVQEVFDAELLCGVCHGPHLRFLARKVDDYDFYELACLNQECRARFAFGQAKKGGALFPKRKDEDGNWLPNGGWSRYEKPTEGGGKHQAPVGATSPAPSAPKPEKKNGVPVYATWQDAERSAHWGQQWLDVGGKLFKLSPDGANYNEVQRTTANSST